MAQGQDSSKQYLLPPLHFGQDPPELQSPEFISSWSPFDSNRSANRPHIRYEAAEQTDTTPTVGLGISDNKGHSRTESNITTGTNGTDPDISDRPSRFHGSQSTLLDDPNHQHSPGCRTSKTIVQRRLSWIPLTIIVLAVYATALSGLYLVVALVKPRYGKFVGVNSRIAPSTANLLSALFAKTIELAYVTVCVAFLGQVLTRRAITKGSHGISISDMSMRSWIMQPGSLIVHWESLRYSALTILGTITLTATLVAMLYTTAAEALVSPKLVPGPVESRLMYGEVYASFANPTYLAENCPTPVQLSVDPDYRNSTCLDMQHVGEAYHNYQAYLETWANIANTTHPAASTNLRRRPPPTGSLHDNTTITGSWIDIGNVTHLSHKHGRLVLNVTAAMPHGGILNAATNHLNHIQQPTDLSGEDNYILEAGVPSPAVNVLCVGMTAAELSPIVYNTWPSGNKTFNPVNYTNAVPGDIPAQRNKTVVDALFGWGHNLSDPTTQYAPVFGKLPDTYDTLLNTTGAWPTFAVYLLGKAAPNTSAEYVVCALKAKQTPHCSTSYSVAFSGASLATRCESKSNKLQYNRLVPNMIDGTWSSDWKNIASQWATSLSLGTGITDGRASNSRLLMQLVPKSFKFDPRLPSIGEALAVLAGSTLIMSTQNAPFLAYWNYTEATSFTSPKIESFTGTIQSTGYAAGGTERWQGVFYIILVFAFVTSAICLAFMVLEVRGRQVTDFTEPQNLFALAMGSPSSVRLNGACGVGPQGRQLGEKWYVAMDEEEEHYYIRTKAEENTPASRVVSGVGSGIVSGTGFSPLGMEVEEGGKLVGGSPLAEEYRRLSARRSFLSRWY